MASSSQRQNERGNALWFILIVLVLIGLLTAVMSRSGSNVEQTGSFEQNSIVASQIMRFAKGVETAITNMKLQGIGENQISFEDGDTGATYENTNCTSNACLVFHVEGGGISYQTAPSGAGSATDWTFVGTNDVSGIGSTNADLIIMLENINQGICDQINRQVGLTYADDADVDTTAFQGAYANTQTLDDASRKTTGCLGNDGDRFFYHVLIQR